MAAAGCSLDCRALAPARAAAAAAAPDDAEEEESRVRRRRMLAVMLLPWLPNSAAAPLRATAAPAPRSARTHGCQAALDVQAQGCHPRAPLHRESGSQEDGGHSLARFWGSGKTDGVMNLKCLHSALVGKELAALQRSNSSLQEGKISFFRGFLHFYKELNKTAKLRKGMIFKVAAVMQFQTFSFFN